MTLPSPPRRLRPRPPSPPAAVDGFEAFHGDAVPVWRPISIVEPVILTARGEAFHRPRAARRLLDGTEAAWSLETVCGRLDGFAATPELADLLKRHRCVACYGAAGTETDH